MPEVVAAGSASPLWLAEERFLFARPGMVEFPEGPRAPELDGGVGWINTDKPIRLKDLKGKVVLLDFWTLC